MHDQPANLYLIPTPLAEGSLDVFPDETIRVIHSLTHFITEKSKTSRRFIKASGHPLAQSELTVLEIPKHDRIDFKELLSPCLEGHPTGLMSEAGAPCIADPGGEIVRKAHDWNIPVVPLTGPSAIFLALMASGMNGQRFTFNGYLPAKKGDLAGALRHLERISAKERSTQLFIETPYRNTQLIQSAIHCLQANTMFGISANIHSGNAYFKTKRIAEWNKTNIPDFHKIPIVYSLLSS